MPIFSGLILLLTLNFLGMYNSLSHLYEYIREVNLKLYCWNCSLTGVLFLTLCLDIFLPALLAHHLVYGGNLLTCVIRESSATS